MPSTSQATPTNQQGHEWIQFRGAEPQLCRHCGLHRAAFIASGKKTTCPVGPALRPTEDPEPDESDTCAVYHPRTLAVKFCKNEDEAGTMRVTEAMRPAAATPPA